MVSSCREYPTAPRRAAGLESSVAKDYIITENAWGLNAYGFGPDPRSENGDRHDETFSASSKNTLPGTPFWNVIFT